MRHGEGAEATTQREGASDHESDDPMLHPRKVTHRFLTSLGDVLINLRASMIESAFQNRYVDGVKGFPVC